LVGGSKREHRTHSVPSHAEYYKRLDDEKMAALNEAAG
jgi:hypothetical protein